jgi:hypothetical protein
MFELEDWEKFRTLDGLSSKAGVPRDRIASLVAKELMDNALDTGSSCEVGLLEGGSGFYIQDCGHGLDPAKVADLFSFGRSLKSTKLLRLPSRGALGNGLRVVAGAVLATGGKLRVLTRGQVLNLVPRTDGTTESEIIGEYDGEGLRVEVQFGSDAGSINRNTLWWAYRARAFAGGQYYLGKTSSWWYTSTDFHELCLAAKGMTVRELVSQFDGCGGNPQLGQITNGFKGIQASTVTQDDAKILLNWMRMISKPVNPKRLGCCNNSDLEGALGYYAIVTNTFKLESNSEVAEIPYVVEAWTKFKAQAAIYFHVNRTPITGEVAANHFKTDLCLSGCNLSEEGYVHPIDIGKRPVSVYLNIITPFMPITSTGKSPDLRHFLRGITAAIEKSVNKTKRNAPKKSARSQKEILLEHLEEGMAKAGGGHHQYSQRQLFYVIRSFLTAELGIELKFNTFKAIITDFESSIGHDLQGMYRDDRGVIYHPHTHETIPLGTRMVESYVAPDWTFNKVLYIEKEGFFQILIDDHWPEMHDCALLTSKGQATRAAKDLIDRLKDSKEEITFYCVHDADAYGTTIYQALQEATKARPARAVNVVNLGMEPQEGMDMELEVEAVEKRKERRPVAEYVPANWAEWLQTHRIELNAMNSPQFLQWLNGKMEKFGQGKLIPPAEVLETELRERAYERLAQDIRDQILRDNDAEGQINRAYEKLQPTLDKNAKDLIADVVKALDEVPEQSWRHPILKLANHLVDVEVIRS